MEQLEGTIKAAIEAMIPKLLEQFRIDLLQPVLERIRELESATNGVVSEQREMRSQIHQLLEDKEVKENKENYSDIILYGIKENPTERVKEVAMAVLSRIGITEDEAMGEMIVTAKRIGRDPRPGQHRPIIATLGSDVLREKVMKEGIKVLKKEKKAPTQTTNTPSGIGDNVVIETRLKRKVLFYIAQKLRDSGNIAIVPNGVKAKLLYAQKPKSDQGDQADKINFAKYTYEEALAEFRSKIQETEYEDMKKELKLPHKYNRSAVLLL